LRDESVDLLTAASKSQAKVWKISVKVSTLYDPFICPSKSKWLLSYEFADLLPDVAKSQTKV